MVNSEYFIFAFCWKYFSSKTQLIPILLFVLWSIFHSAGKLYSSLEFCRTTKLLISELSLDKSCILDIFSVGFTFFTNVFGVLECGKRHTENNVKGKKKLKTLFLPFFGLTSTQARLPAEFKHIIKRRKRN